MRIPGSFRHTGRAAVHPEHMSDPFCSSPSLRGMYRTYNVSPRQLCARAVFAAGVVNDVNPCGAEGLLLLTVHAWVCACLPDDRRQTLLETNSAGRGGFKTHALRAAHSVADTHHSNIGSGSGCGI